MEEQQIEIKFKLKHTASNVHSALFINDEHCLELKHYVERKFHEVDKISKVFEALMNDDGLTEFEKALCFYLLGEFHEQQFSRGYCR